MIITDDIQRETADSIRREGIYDVQVGTFPMTEEFILGFGDGGTCGTHWDVVIANPTYEVKRCLK